MRRSLNQMYATAKGTVGASQHSSLIKGPCARRQAFPTSLYVAKQAPRDMKVAVVSRCDQRSWLVSIIISIWDLAGDLRISTRQTRTETDQAVSGERKKNRGSEQDVEKIAQGMVQRCDRAAFSKCRTFPLHEQIREGHDKSSSASLGIRYSETCLANQQFGSSEVFDFCGKVFWAACFRFGAEPSAVHLHDSLNPNRDKE